MAVVSIGIGSQASVINTEHSLAQVTAVGIYVLQVDASALAVGDTLEIRIKTTCRNGDPLKTAYLETLVGAQYNVNWHSVPVPVASGDQISVTITQTTGVARSFPWNLMRM